MFFECARARAEEALAREAGTGKTEIVYFVASDFVPSREEARVFFFVSVFGESVYTCVFSDYVCVHVFMYVICIYVHGQDGDCLLHCLLRGPGLCALPRGGAGGFYFYVHFCNFDREIDK